MPKIAISYRRADTQQIVGRILDRLAQRYGKDEVYIDIGNIPAGIDFRSDIGRALGEVVVVLVVVGPQWRGPPNQDPPRIFAADDPVRKEVETALASNRRIVPLLIDQTAMPAADALPGSLREFSFLNALPVDTGRDFENHIARLITELDPILGLSAPIPDGRDAPTGDAVAATIPALVAGYLVGPAALMALAYYAMVYKLNQGLGYVEIVSVSIALAAGLLLAHRERRGLEWAVLIGAGAALLAVAVMQAIAAMIDGGSFLPRTERDWQEAAEVAVVIVVGFAGGSLLGRALRARLAVRARPKAP